MKRFLKPFFGAPRRRAFSFGRRRSGVAMILLIGMLGILIGSAAFAVDFSQMYVSKAQLQSSADAAAMAGVMALGDGLQAQGIDSAVAYNAKNAVNKSTTTLARADVHPGTWSGSAFVATSPADDWTNASANTVQVTARYTGSYIFARIYGFSGASLTATAVAVRGGIKGTGCVRPWAFDYQSLLDKLYTPGTKNPSHNLTPGDIKRLNTLGITGTGSVTFDGVKLPPGEYADGTQGHPWPGGANYRTAEGASCTALDAMIAAQEPTKPYVSAGDWLDPENGVKTGPTKQGINDLCGSDTCNPAYPINVALYDVQGSAPNGHCGSCWHIKYMAKFMLQGYDNGSKSPYGYFVGSNSNEGGFTTSPAPIQKNALVK